MMEMFESTIAVREAIHEEFMSHAPKERQALLDACIGSGTASEEWWKNTLLSYEEMPDSPEDLIIQGEANGSPSKREAQR